MEENRLLKIRDQIVVDMPYERHTERHMKFIMADVDREAYNRVFKDRWDIWNDEPLKNVTQLIYGIRRVANEDPSRREELDRLLDKHPRMIIFYNFTYELELLREYMEKRGLTYAEWNGQKHQEIPDTDSWAYLVQYTAGAEGWNCTSTDAMVFYSLQYSWKVFEQCQGRIDRLNTPFKDLYYYVLRSNTSIDHNIWKALSTKKNFQEKKFTREHYLDEFTFPTAGETQ